MSNIACLLILTLLLNTATACVRSDPVQTPPSETSHMFCNELAEQASKHGLILDHCQAYQTGHYSIATNAHLRSEGTLKSVTLERTFSVKDAQLRPSLIRRFAAIIVETALRDLS